MSPAARRAATLVVLAVVLSTACVLLGRWQWNRHVHRDAAIRQVEAAYDADPVPLADLLGSPDADLAGADVWHPVTVTGRYDVDATVLLRNRPVDGQPGFHVLVPLVVEGTDAVLVVDRGWVAWQEDASAQVDVPAPPPSEVTVTVRLRPGEAATDRDAPAGQVQAVAVDQVLAVGGLSSGTVAYRSAYGSLVAEDPAPAVPLGALPAPSTDPGSHLSYAFQWWTFALGSLVGLTWMARRELRDAREARAARDAAEGRPAPVGPRPALGDLLPTDDPDLPGGRVRAPRRRRPSDEETEDALIDAQAQQPRQTRPAPR